ncbi:hypothetical protein F5I97DRAFT_1802765 [Phlebopus sp. FC_14]|nr:hypothetical protein F5I97DRAFT_1802765 [Phlebopus sp. FC_14]
MLTGSTSDVYSPFPLGIVVEDGPQSSEDGSGLHSPIIGAPFPHIHGDIRYHNDQLDIHNAAGVLASQFDYASFNAQPSHGPPHYLPSLDLPSNFSGNYSYSHHYPPPPRNHLGLDIPSHSFSNTRLPPPLPQGGPISLGYQPPLHRRYSGDISRDQSYTPPAQTPSIPVPAEPDQRTTTPRRDSAPPKSQPPPPPTSASQDPPRRESSNTVIACRQCRARKIRCDSTRPMCHNCTRRSNECQYDAVPKRRGPDKRPGTRQRSCKKRPTDGSAPPVPHSKRKKAADGQNTQERRGPPDTLSLRTTALEHHGSTLNQSSVSPQASDFSPSVRARDLPADSYSTHSDRHQVDKFRVPPSPPVPYDRKEWWDNLLNSYSATRDQSLKDIMADLSALFSTTGYWLSFVNVNELVQSLYSPEKLSSMQPSLIFAGLALATFIKSSTIELGPGGHTRALWLRDQAQAMLETSCNSQWVDVALAKAALILAIYESCAHPHYTPERARQSLIRLDHIVRQLGLTYVDGNTPGVSTFPPSSGHIAHRHPMDISSRDGLHSSRLKCTCISLPSTLSVTSSSCAPPWDPSWTVEETHKESCRRVCWSALNLVASYTSQCIAFRKEPTDLFLTDPANFQLLFPGEANEHEHKARSSKDSIWALFCRSMLLWNFCTTRLRKNTFSSKETSELAMESWRETQEIQDALDAHTCNVEPALFYRCREYVYTTQMMLASILRTLHGPEAGNIPSFSRKHTEHWLRYQSHFIRRVRLSIDRLGEPEGALFTRRPFDVTWFASQVSICLFLWEHDRTLVEALEVAKDIIVPVDVLNTLWPCPMLQSRCDELRKRVADACHSIPISPPMPSTYSLPLHVRGG